MERDVINKAANELGPHGSGVFVLRQVFTQSQLEHTRKVINDDKWIDAHEEYITTSGSQFSMRRHSVGYQLQNNTYPDHVAPYIKISEELVWLLSSHFPNLQQWSPDELSFHSYDEDFGLGEHRDERIFGGLIFNVCIGGSRVLETSQPQQTATTLSEGDLFLMRATGLYGDKTQPYQIIDNPLHSVPRILKKPSFTLLIRSLMGQEADLSRYRLNML